MFVDSGEQRAPDGKAMVIVLWDPPGVALTVLSCSVNLPSVSSGQKDVITIFS